MNAISLTEFKIRPEDVCEPLRHLDVMHVYLLMPEETQNVRGILNRVWRDVRSPLTRTFFFFFFLLHVADPEVSGHGVVSQGDSGLQLGRRFPEYDIRTAVERS